MSVHSKMTAIADAIRAKTGDTSALTLDQMAIDIANIDTSENLDDVLAEQETLIDDIKTALEGKMSSSEDLSTELAEYTALNAELEEVIDSLPDAGGSGGVEYGWFSVHGWVGAHDPTGSNAYSYKFPFEIGMTWGEWVATPLNVRVFVYEWGMQQLYANGNQIYGLLPSLGSNYPLCSSTSPSDAVTLSDTIINGATYYINYVSSGGGGYD